MTEPVAIQETEGTEENNTVTTSVRTAARALGVMFVGFILYRWWLFLPFPIRDSLSTLTWRQWIIFDIDVIAIAGVVIAWSHERIGAWIIFIGVLVFGITGLSFLADIYVSSNLILGISVAAMFLFSTYLHYPMPVSERRMQLAY